MRAQEAILLNPWPTLRTSLSPMAFLGVTAAVTCTVSHLLPLLWREWVCFWLHLPSKGGRVSQSHGRESTRQAHRHWLLLTSFLTWISYYYVQTILLHVVLPETPFPLGGEKEKRGVGAGLHAGNLPPHHTHTRTCLSICK